MKFRRGFKAEAEAYAVEFRQELDLEPHMPLCPWKLANHLSIPIVTLSDMECQTPDAVRVLKTTGRSDFSAVTIHEGTKRFIVHNDSHAPKRQASNLAHEISHGILGHPASPPLDEKGERYYDQNIENEANWLGATLLVPRPAALHILLNKMTPDQACNLYNVSRQLLDWRINTTGVKTQVSRRKRQWH